MCVGAFPILGDKLNCYRELYYDFPDKVSIKTPLCNEVSITRAPSRVPAASTETVIRAPLSCPVPICCKIEGKARICRCSRLGARVLGLCFLSSYLHRLD